MKRKYRKSYWSPNKQIELEIALFLTFHDYYKVDKPKTKNDGCLEMMVKNIVYITKHPEKYQFIKTRSIDIK